MDPIVELLTEMRGRLPMYVGTNSINKLAAFLRGYDYALARRGLERTPVFLPALQQIVEKRYQVKVSKGWEDIILFHSSDDNEAIDMFWRLFDEFRKSGDKEIKGDADQFRN